MGSALFATGRDEPYDDDGRCDEGNDEEGDCRYASSDFACTNNSLNMSLLSRCPDGSSGKLGLAANAHVIVVTRRSARLSSLSTVIVTASAALVRWRVAVSVSALHKHHLTERVATVLTVEPPKVHGAVALSVGALVTADSVLIV